MKFLINRKGERRIISEIVILSVIFGFAAGVVGQIVSDVYIDPFSQNYSSGDFGADQGTVSIPELRRVKRFLGIEQDFEVNKSVQQVLPSLVGVYSRKPTSQNILNQIYLPQELLGNGFILTSDGWIVTYRSVVVGYDFDRLTVVYQGKEYPIDQLIQDSTTGITFLKISASNLPVVVMGDSDENVSGQLAVSVNSLGEVVVANIQSHSYRPKSKSSDFVLSSEKYSEFILVNIDPNGQYLGSPLLNLAGEVTGVVNEIDSDNQTMTVVPINQFRPIVVGILKDGIVKRPYLGVNYIDLARTIGVSDSGNQGALVYSRPTRNSPAADADLQIDDVIISVEGQTINSDNNLTKMIQQYRPGDELTLEIIRGGKRISKKVTLSLLPE